LTCGVDNMVRKWDLTTDQPREISSFKVSSGSCAAAFTNGEMVSALATFGASLENADPNIWQPARTVRVWDVTGQAPKVKAVLGKTLDGASVPLALDGQRLVTGAGNRIVNADPPTSGELRLWLLNDVGPNKRHLLFDGVSEPINSVAFSPDGQLLVSTGMRGQVALWESATRQKIR